MNINYNDLPNIIKQDLFLYNKIHLLLLIAILISANSIILVVYHTRLLVIQKEELIIKNKKANILWNNLIMRKNTLR